MTLLCVNSECHNHTICMIFSKFAQTFYLIISFLKVGIQGDFFKLLEIQCR